MGFLGLIPASELTASYNVRTQKLTLHASGEVQDITTGISFHRLHLLGALEFALEGWTGPLSDKKSKYSHSQDFDIQLPNCATPSGNVIIVDANNPKGKAIHIRFVGGIVPPPNEGEPKEPLELPAAAEHAMLTAPHNLVVDILNHPFKVSEAAEVHKFGSVHVRYDAEFVTLQTAGIEGSQIVWTFVGKKVGRTQVVVTISGGVAKFLMTKVYDVSIVRMLDEDKEEGEGEEGGKEVEKNGS